MARIFDAGIDVVQSLVMRALRIPSPCRAAAAAFLSARISFQEAISKDFEIRSFKRRQRSRNSPSFPGTGSVGDSARGIVIWAYL
jgi:hypothetical protein